MFANILGWILILAIAIFFGWLAFRARKTKSPVLKWIGIALSGLLALLASFIAVVALIGLIKVYTPVKASTPQLSVAGASPTQVQRGEHLANAFCASCHSANNQLPLTGGVDLGKDFPAPLGAFVSANLTPAGPLKGWSDGQVFRAIRNGIDPDGRRLMIMSTARGRHLSDEDILALVAFLRSQPAVENPTPNPLDQPGLLAVIMSGAGLIPEGEPPSTTVITAPPKGPTASYGEYILSYQDCRECHGQDLSGGKPGQLAPVGPNLRVVKGWTKDQFMTTLRTGIDPSNHTLSSQMPWKNIGRMDDEELAAIHAYLTSLP